MTLYLSIGGVVAASLLSLVFSSLTYSLREYSRGALAEYLGRHDGDRWFEPITDHTSDLIFITAVGRQLCNILMFVLTFAAFEQTSYGPALRYSLTVLVAGVIAIFCSITLPHAGARYASAQIVGFFAPVLRVLGVMFSPVAGLMHGTDDVVRRALGAREKVTETQIDEGILSAVEEGEKEGFVDEQEREMIESIINLGDTRAGHIMTSRPEIAAVPVEATLEQVKALIEQQGHSRLPVYESTLDHVVGFLHARDLIKHVGVTNPRFDVRTMMRPAFFVPETKPLGDLLKDFRLQSVHIAVVQDEYGSTAGIVTLEDIFEELVGEIADEHEPSEPAMLKRLDDRIVEADARIQIEELNRLVGLSLPEDAGYETLGGFLSSSLAKVPQKDVVYEHDGVRYTVLDAEPQRVKRVKIEMLTPAPAATERT
jgi:putative hemolysin